MTRQQPSPSAAVRFLPQTRVKLELAIKCNREIAEQYAELNTDAARKWHLHHMARVEACESKLDRMDREGIDDD